MTFSLSSFASNAAADGYASATLYARDAVANIAAGRTPILRTQLNSLLGGTAITAITLLQPAVASTVMNMTIPVNSATTGMSAMLVRANLDVAVRCFG